MNACYSRHKLDLEPVMRTTLDIDDTVLAAIKELAQREGRSAGAVLSDMARKVLMQGGLQGGLTQEVSAQADSTRETPAVYGFRPLPAGNEIVTNALVDKLRDEQGV